MYNLGMKVAIVHDYLTQYGGAEKTLEAILEMFPQATIYTGVYNPDNMSEIINSHKVISPNNSLLVSFPKYFTFLMPLIFENFDLREFDLIISSGTAWAKSVITDADQLHVAYIHTPPRFLYGYSVESQIRDKWYFKPFVAIIDLYLRMWDFAAAQRPDFLLTNSNEVRERIEKFYKRGATVIYPPVETTGTGAQTELTKRVDKPYYLALGRLAAYKNFDLLIEAFKNTNLTLVIAGTGPEEAKLNALADSHVMMLGKVTEAEKHELLEHCLGLLFPVVDEDFGIVPVEAMAHGRPVLAHKSGGVKETVRDGKDGMFFEQLDVESVKAALMEFDAKVTSGTFNKEEIKAQAAKFDKENFKTALAKFISDHSEQR